MKKLAALLMLLPMLALADVSLYRGLATTHLFSNNSELNNDNGVTIIKAGDFLAGYMTNSFNEQGYLIGYQPKVWEHGNWEAYAGLTAIKGYRRWQVPTFRGYTIENQDDHVNVITSALSVSYSFTDNVAVQLNNLSGIVFNLGVRLDF